VLDLSSLNVRIDAGHVSCNVIDQSACRS
jgi:hypothetical protein